MSLEDLVSRRGSDGKKGAKEAEGSKGSGKAKGAEVAEGTEVTKGAEVAEGTEKADESGKNKGGEKPPKKKKSKSRRRSAESMASGQRDISVSEFFVKNRHLLGFDSPARALLTTVKEAVDNALDACEDGGILPTLVVEIEEVGDKRYRVAVQDNGPGIVKKQVPKIFGKLLYGSKFHKLKQSRGQQGIGISAAGMYGQLTTGKPVVITSRTGAQRPAHHFEIVINTRRNVPEVIKDVEVEWEDVDHGTRVEIELEGTYKGGKRSIDEYLEHTAIANPHAEIWYYPPKGKEPNVMERVTEELPVEPAEIKPHPHGVELGLLMKMLKESKARNIQTALMNDFSRVSARVAEEICDKAGVSRRARTKRIANNDVEAIYKAISEVKIMAPPTNCIVPIGEDLILKGLEREIDDAEFYACRTRPPKVYRGNPFQVEAGLAYGGELTGLMDHGEEHEEGEGGVWIGGTRLAKNKSIDRALGAIPGLTRKKVVELLRKAGVNRATKVRLLKELEIVRIRGALDAGVRAEAQSRPVQLVRLANRVPLQYQQSACSIYKAVTEVNWRRYGLNQPRGGLPTGPMVLMVHISSVWVPFTSESKEAIAHYQEIIDEVQRAAQDCGRELGRHLRRRSKEKARAQRRQKLEIYSGELIESLHRLTGKGKKELKTVFKQAANHFAAVEGEDAGQN